MKLYLKYYFIFLCTGAVFFATLLLYLFRAGEYMSAEEVVTKQLLSPGKSIYGSALHNNTTHYKRELLEANNSEVVVLGSSRVLQFRQHMFRSTTVNLGSAMNSLVEGAETATHVVAARPAVALLGIDIWWFNENKPVTMNVLNAGESMDISPKAKDMLSVLDWLVRGKITFGSIIELLTSQTIEDIGVAGLKKDGFGPDGSNYYTRTITGNKSSKDWRFRDTFSRIEHGVHRFQYSKEASESRIATLKEIINTLEAAQIHTVVFFPPLAKVVIDKMVSKGQNYDYIDDLKEKLNKSQVKYYDYSDPALLGSSDCEFFDGFHGGEITYGRLLLNLASRDPKLATFVRHDHLKALVENYTGMTFVPDPEITTGPEIDFLGLGCPKQRAQGNQPLPGGLY